MELDNNNTNQSTKITFVDISKCVEVSYISANIGDLYTSKRKRDIAWSGKIACSMTE